MYQKNESEDLLELNDGTQFTISVENIEPLKEKIPVKILGERNTKYKTIYRGTRICFNLETIDEKLKRVLRSEETYAIVIRNENFSIQGKFADCITDGNNFNNGFYALSPTYIKKE